MGYNKGLRDRLDLDKPSIIKMVITAGIAVCIMLIVMFTQTVTKGTYNADMGSMEEVTTTHSAQIANHTQGIGELREDMTTISEQYSGVANTVALHTGNISSLQGRIATAESDITAMETVIATIGSPPEGYLTGNLTSGNLTLHAKASDAGNYTANIYLAFSPPISAGNATTEDDAIAAFYASVNWTAANTTSYTPVVYYNGTAWKIGLVRWNIGTFVLTADNETAISVLFGGIADTPKFAYAEVYPVLK